MGKERTSIWSGANSVCVPKEQFRFSMPLLSPEDGKSNLHLSLLRGRELVVNLRSALQYWSRTFQRGL